MLYANPNLDNMQWNQPLWFLPCLMIQLIIINIIENIIKDKRNKQKIRLLVVIISVLLGSVLSELKIYLPLQLEAAMCMSIFTYLGIFVKENKEKIKDNKLCQYVKNRKIVMFAFIIITIIISCFLVHYNETLSVMQDKYGNYAIYIIVSTIMIINVMLISNVIDKVWSKQKIISYIGQSTLMILLLHKFPILFFQELCPIIKDLLNKDDTIMNNIICIIISIVVIAMCMVCKYIIDIIRRKQYDRN